MYQRTIADDIKEVELSIEEAKKAVEIRDAIARLEKNRDFKKVILDLYFGDHAQRIAHLYSDPNVEREEVHNQLIGIGVLKQFLLAQRQMGQNALDAMQDYEGTLDELRSQEAEGSDA